MALPYRTTGSLGPTFVPARRVSLAVKLACALAHPAYQRGGLPRPYREVEPPGDLIFRRVSRLDAFSGYLFRA